MSFYDRYDEDYEDDEDQGITCIYCNASGLVWEDNDSGLKFYTEDHQKHVCTGRNKPSADDFEVV